MANSDLGCRQVAIAIQKSPAVNSCRPNLGSQTISIYPPSTDIIVSERRNEDKRQSLASTYLTCILSKQEIEEQFL